ncbi:hypothetical protein BDF22DRAFT_743916 [Syncephalis plumigaleata]|nr:hypothetical protein BDF22DRAFT_743916 [Syncephalis plumigaleata]
MPPITTLIGMSDDENVINSSEQLPSSWQTESQVQTRLETVLGANTIKCIELPRNDHGRVRGWCFIQFTSKALADQFISIAMTQSTLEQVADTIESSKTEANQQDSDDNDCSALHNELKDTRLMSL